MATRISACRGWYLPVDVCTPPEAQSLQDRAALPSFQRRNLLSMTFPLSVRTWVWQWMTSCPAQPTSLRQPITTDSSSTTSGTYICSVPYLGGGADSGPGCCYLTPWLVQLGPGLCADYYSSSRMQQPEWSSTYPSSPTPHRYCAHCTGYRWLLESDLRQWYLPTALRMALAHSSSRTLSNRTPQPVHYALLLPNGLLLPHYEWGPVIAQQNHDCLLSWLHKGGSSPLTSSQLKLFTPSVADWKLICSDCPLAHEVVVLADLEVWCTCMILATFCLYPPGWMHLL